MASLVLLRNPLAPQSRELHQLEPGILAIDWLQKHHPDGFGMPIKFYLNGDERDLDELDLPLVETDVVVIALMPAESAALLTMMLISTALSLLTAFVMQAFMPKVSQPKYSGQVTTFDIASGQNSARIGEAIPVVYGTVIMLPDYVAQPYTFTLQNQANYNQLYNGVQYLDMILCVGQGNVNVSEVYIGDTAASALASGVVKWRSFTPAQHKKTAGVISSAMGGGFYENVVTSPEVSSQEFKDENDSAGYYSVCKPGQTTSHVMLDFVFPSGQTNPTDNNNIKGRSTLFTVYYREINDNDTPISSVLSQEIECSTIAGDTVTASTIGETYRITGGSEKNRTAIMSPLRRTFNLNLPRSARWSVKIVRNEKAPNANNGNDRFVWSGMKAILTHPGGPVYGDVTLLAVRIKASNGVGNDAAVRIRAKVTRMLPPPVGGAESANTSATDAIADIYTNTIYGADRPRTELDVATLNVLRNKWDGYKFNYVFTGQTTVWEAIRTVTIPFGAEPLPIGALMSVAQDGVKSIRSALFTDANIVENSMRVDYSFDDPGSPDGVEIEYINPVDFSQAFVRYPSTSIKPQRFMLPGCTNSTHAAQYARLTWQRSRQQRKRITFDTELEGLLLQLGDRIAVSHNVPKWGDSGLVIGMTGNSLQVDHDLVWGSSMKIMLRRNDGSVTDPIAVSRGSSDDIVILPSASPVTPNINSNYEFTSFAFGTSATIVRDFIVLSTKPNDGNTVTIEATNYAPNMFTGAMTYMD